MESFRFYSPEFLYLLLLLPVLLIASYIWKNNSNKYIALISNSYFFHKKKVYFLEIIALIFLIFSMARPQANPVYEEVYSTGKDIIFALDLSNSMNAKDIYPTRLKQGKRTIKQILQELAGARVGLVAFAGSAALVAPLTTDYSIIDTLLQSLDTRTFDRQGTNISAAISIAREAFHRVSKGNFNKQTGSRLILILSDGESTLKKDLDIASKVNKEGIRVSSIAIGTEKGAPIPVIGLDGSLKGYKRDNLGVPVVSRVDSSYLKSLAKAGSGNFYRNNVQKSDIAEITSVKSFSKEFNFKKNKLEVYKEYFFIPLFIGIIILFFSYIFSIFFRKSTFIFLFLIPFSQESLSKTDDIEENNILINQDKRDKFSIEDLFFDKKREKNRKAIREYEKGNFDESIRILTELQAEDSSSDKLAYNVGTNLIKNKKIDEAKKVLNNLDKDESIKRLADFNLAGAYATGGKKEESLEKYASLIQSITGKENKTKEEKELLEQAKKNVAFLLKNDEQKQDKQNNSNQNKKENKNNKNNKNNKDKQENNKPNESQENKSNKDDQKQNMQENKEEENKEKQSPKENKSIDKNEKEGKELDEKRAEEMLRYLREQEVKLQRQLINKGKEKYEPSPNGKDW